jgi:hypothetical protein
MQARSVNLSLPNRASSARRLRRRATAAGRLYCSTNGCTSYLEEDARTGTASCQICGYVRRLS